ncbi:MAG: S-layer homology domain-containing protein [Clostridia bacterium]|nr:S-layer homology domain-containing protein [Clostridia bacterium]
MKLKLRIAALLMTAILLSGVLTAAADPVVTRSYLTDTYQPYIMSQTQQMLESAFAALEETLEKNFSTGSLRVQIGSELWLDTMNARAMRTLTSGSYTLSSGSVVTGALGTKFTLVSGSAEVVAAAGTVLVDASEGVGCADGTALVPGHLYIIADTGGCGLRASAGTAVVTVSGSAKLLGVASSGGIVEKPSDPVTPGVYTEQYLRYAQALREMGLFKGTNAGFELTREATRVEALVMLVRLLGEEDEALASTAKHPFKDVPAWADRHVAYAYARGYTNGISADKYGSDQSATREQYLTFLLRALGYNDAAGDFVWSKASEKAQQIGMLTFADVNAMSSVFYRDHVAFSSYKALMTAKKDATVRLLDILIDSGTVAIDAAYRATVIVG